MTEPAKDMPVRAATACEHVRNAKRRITRRSVRRHRSLGLALCALALAVSILCVGLPTTLSIGGGVALIAFGSLWPALWLAGLLPAGRVPFIRPQHAPRDLESPGPSIVVLAPARNEEPVAERLVTQFLDQDYDNWQLVVIANNCTDATADVARRAAGGDPRVRVIEATFENGVKADALNLALAQVTADVVLELDADNQVPSDLLSKLARAFADPEVDAVQTQIRAYNATDGLLAALQDLEFLVYSEIWNRGRCALGLGSSIGGTGFAARTHILKGLKGWTRDLVEDFEMHTRLVAHGIHVTYLPWAVVYDEKPVTWGALIRQRKRWIRGHLEIAARRSRADDALGPVDQFYLYSPLFVVLSMTLFAMGYASLVFPGWIHGYAYFSPWFWLISVAVMIVALVTTVMRAKSYRLLPLVPLYLLFFSFHWMIVFCAAVFPVSWAQSKTVHGVSADGGLRAWLGLDGRESVRQFAAVALIAVLWMYPLFDGLRSAPPLFEATVLYAGRSVATAMADGSELDGTVQGRIQAANGGPLADVSVVVTGPTGVVWRTRSNGSGDFLVMGLEPAEGYRIDLTKDGYQPASTLFEMPANGGVWVSATLSTGQGGIIVVPIPY